MRSLSSSRTSSTVEIEALLSQIEASMTAGQLEAASSLKLYSGAAGEGYAALESSSPASSPTTTTSGTTPPSQGETTSSGGMPAVFGAASADSSSPGMMGAEMLAAETTEAGQPAGSNALVSPAGSITININLVEKVIAVLEQKLT